jgi:lipopolysaccharide/colanic/teichoic acid biosynthesis glycosyltransferase
LQAKSTLQKKYMYRLFFKRLFDVVCSVLFLLVLSPLFLCIYMALFFVNKGDVFFKQRRPGKNERLFTLLKFKTMTGYKNSDGVLLPDELRVTWLGKILRYTSLDELPQLINVLTGDMSLVGPRPLLEEYLFLYNEQQKKRHDVRPGITGWAQVNGRNSLGWQQKFALDVYYVNNINLIFDIKIILLTLVKLIKAEGIAGNGIISTEKFKGN